MKHRATCHCGNVAVEFEGEIAEVVSCNCSICQRKGSLLWFTPRDRLTLLSADDAASTYEFNRHRIRHRFCPRCGIHPYAEGVDPKGNAVAAINVRCVESVDLTALSIKHVDGRSL